MKTKSFTENIKKYQWMFKIPDRPKDIYLILNIKNIQYPLMRVNEGELLNNLNGSIGIPLNFCLIKDAIYLFPVPDSSYDIEIVYTINQRLAYIPDDT